MEIYGREYGFALTVGSSAEISDLCPNGEMKNLGSILKGKASDSLKSIGKMICIMSKAYENRKHFTDPSYVPCPITEELLETLTMEEFREVQKAMMDSFIKDRKQTVEVAASKKDTEPALS